MTLYVSYQQDGGQDEWSPAHLGGDYIKSKPAFVTVLACDKLLTKHSPKSMVEDAKYLGPLYFDLDNEADIEAAVEDALFLWGKLQEKGLTEDDVEFYLSGKKGIHVLIPPEVFMEKVAPVPRLFAIYKEIAFVYATPSTDFNVYSGRSGRMFRTTYAQRENGNWKVRVYPSELQGMTVESYNRFCSTETRVWQSTPKYRPAFAIVYEGILQRIQANKKAKTKPVDAATLRRQAPTVEKVMRGEGLKPDLGFNKVAIQLALYAHEAKMTEAQFVQACEGLVNNHQGDGFRYNTPEKRKAELARMYDYLEESGTYTYAFGPIEAFIAPVVAEEGEEPVEDDFEVEDIGGLFTKGANYFAATEQGDRHIMDAKLVEATILKDPMTEQIAAISAKLQKGRKVAPIGLERQDFASSASLHKAVSLLGASFTGTDIHARNIFSLMLRESANGKTIYATGREGLDVLKMPMSDIAEAREPFIVWTDGHGVRVPQHLLDLGLEVRFMGYPVAEGVMKTDLANTPPYSAWSEEAGNKEKLATMLRGLLTCQEPSALAKLLGWMAASFYTQLFRRSEGKFPLLHINGAAGSGKSEMTEGLMHLFYHKQEPVIVSPSSTVFAISSTIAGSASIPTIVDEYKPAEMPAMTYNALKSTLRSVYNGHTVSKGGGNRMKETFSALNSVTLSGPVVFIAEALEQETALLERCVVITLRRPFGLMGMRYGTRYAMFQDNKETLSLIGQVMVADIVRNYSVDQLSEDFGAIHKAARATYLMQEGDRENLTAEELKLKEEGRPRVVYNHAVVQFGLARFKAAVQLMLPELAEELATLFKPLEESVFMHMRDTTASTVAEYIKVLLQMSDMTRFPAADSLGLINGTEYETGEHSSRPALTIVTRAAFNKYRIYCKALGVSPLFTDDRAFLHALRNSPLVLAEGSGTKNLRQDTITLDYEGLQRAGCPAWQGVRKS